MAGFPKPCIECGRLSLGDTRCEEHRLERIRIREALRDNRQRSPKPYRAHYTGDYAKRARQVRQNARYCSLCGDGPRHNDPWTADHVRAGDPTSPLMPAHRSCNSRRGNKPIEPKPDSPR
jgi:hypothetical protein